jgi:uncharacterized caspase-like protein
MGIFSRRAFLLLAFLLALTLGHRAASADEARFAFVVGNDEYKTAKLATPANDAGLVANALQAAGFTVTGARNLDQSTLRESIREFLEQVAAAGPDAVALVYLAGFGLQFDGENYFVPVDADIQRDADIPLQAIRISDVTQPLAALPGRVKIVILDAARENQFARGGQPLAGGLALVEPQRSLAIAFNAAPGTVGPEEPGPYGAYATSLTEMIGEGGLSLDDLLARVRLRVSELTKGAEMPWYASQIEGPFFMTERAADAPPPPSAVPVADIRSKPMRDFHSVEDAYAAAVALDTLDGYEQFLAMYPDSPYARRVAAMVAVRREEIIWRRCVIADTPQAYWSYLRRYPRGPHVWDARRRLEILRAMMEPPPDFAFVDFGVPPPPPAELVFVAGPVVMFVGPTFVAPPPPPVIFLPPRPAAFAVLPPPPPPRERFFLPIAAAAAAATIPAFVRPPRTVVVRPMPAGPGSGPGGRPGQGGAGWGPGRGPGGPGAGPGAGPGGRQFTNVTLPAAVARTGPGGVPGLRPGAPGTGAPATVTPLPTPGRPGAPGAAQPAPPTAAIKPGTPPAPPTAPTPSTVKPGTPPTPSTTPTPSTVKPGTPPTPSTTPTPTTVAPATPPSPPTGPTPTTVRPGKPPKGPMGPKPGAVTPGTPPTPPTTTTPTTVTPASPPTPPTAPSPPTVKPAKPLRPGAPPTAAIKPATPPPPRVTPPAPAMMKPAKPPHAPPPAAAAIKPAAPPPPRPPVRAGVPPKPACPPGKHMTPQGCK